MTITNPDTFDIDIALQAVADRKIAITFTIAVDDLEDAAAYLFTETAANAIADNLTGAMS